MSNYYKKILFLLITGILLTLSVAYYGFYQSRLVTPLLPLAVSGIPWRAVVSSDVDDGGSSFYQRYDGESAIKFDFTLGDKAGYPYVSYALRFVQQELSQMRYVDLSQYDRAKLTATCSPANILSFTVFAFDEAVTNPRDIDSHRIPSTYFSCDEKHTEVTIDLRKLETPDWWLRLYSNLAQRDYSLKKSASITIGNSTQSPLLTNTHVVINTLVLEGRDWWRVWIGVVLLVGYWGGAVLLWWRTVKQTPVKPPAAVEEKAVALIAYQQISIEAHKDKERAALLKFMATEYQNANLDLDCVTQKLGMNRSKVNDILKHEVGLTFNVYLNKLRLTEAARLLTENPEANVGEVAYSVGYNNVSYFNRLFKSQYGCTPNVFRQQMHMVKSDLSTSQ